jgi:SET domain-containing protein
MQRNYCHMTILTVTMNLLYLSRENDFFQKDDSELGLKIVNFPEKGRGVITLLPISKGQKVVEYRGERITKEEAEIREKSYDESGQGCYLVEFFHKGIKSFIDATPESGHIGRLLNHSSKKPNCVLKKFEVSGCPRLVLVAKQDICKEEELLWDYGDRRQNIVKAFPWLKE